MANERLTITDVAEKVGVTPKTIVRWEKSGKVKKPKRDWRGWRTYDLEDLRKLEQFKETIVFEEDETEGRSEHVQTVA